MNKTRMRFLPALVFPGLMLLLGSAFCASAWRFAESGMFVRAPLQERPGADRLRRAFDALQDYWRRRFAADGKRYVDARLVLFREGIASSCGDRSAGSFYCPFDGNVYVDLGRYSPAHDRTAQQGNPLQVFALAHEFGHHVQTLRGIAAEISNRRELQADCLAGLAWRGASFNAFTDTLADKNAIERMNAFKRGLVAKRLSEC